MHKTVRTVHRRGVRKIIQYYIYGLSVESSALFEVNTK